MMKEMAALRRTQSYKKWGHRRFLFIFTYDVLCMHMRAPALAHMWRSEDNFEESVLSFHCGVQGSNSGCQTCATSAFTY